MYFAITGEYKKPSFSEKEKKVWGKDFQYRGLARPSVVNNHPCPRPKGAQASDYQTATKSF